MLDGNNMLTARSPVADAQVFTDLKGLNAIKQQGRIDSDEALRNVAQQFESMFVNMMLKSMRAANQVFAKDGLFNSFESDMHQQMYDNQISLNLTEGNGIGLADVLFRQMQQQFSRPDSAQSNDGAMAFSPEQRRTSVQEIASSQTKNVDAERSTTALQSIGDLLPKEVKQVFSSPQDFVATLLPAVKGAAQSLGLNPKALLAQAALETGWGKHFIEQTDGSSSFNLFGIKATGGWSGAEATVPTVEFENGVAKRKYESFRIYDSFAQSAMDFAQLLKNSPRYQQAVDAVDDIGQFWQELQKAGYATDPQYAKKLNTILHGKTLQEALRSVDSQ
ncbi:MAG: flagellar assembly peptidoglycan hydrolase FlgJ [Pseudomonadales bacterium]